MSTMTTSIPFFGYELAYEVEHQWADPGPYARTLDPGWRAVDSNGHGHFAQRSGKRTELPTLAWVSVPCSMGHGDDCDSEGDYRCKICDVVVEPGSKPAEPVQIATTRSYTLTGDGVVYQFGDEQWQAVCAAVAEAVGSTLADYAVERTFTRS